MIPPADTQTGAIQVAADTLWKMQTQSANAALERDDIEQAEQLYASALAEAEDLLAKAENGLNLPQAPVLLVVSHHNIAELELGRSRPARATTHYQAAFDCLLELAAKTTAPDTLRQLCASQLQPAMVALATHLQMTGASRSRIAQEIARVRKLMWTPNARAC
ncbi:hypothetical protein AIOL_003742 [Candidatus Rhodobacter oscarellae]|uniref:Uncharacterized protein n=1 Tax=Candidatus Rhodobacter oscarellae TaxID=1675527 RepID=A0A0J9E7Q9_9RHOB|nr:hypothetical protein [Candidatus Rhodobacter lobularis]KMW58762.1 hypothetical protein AIOL_003742 [Candidatus Rhodobacter lobularis]